MFQAIRRIVDSLSNGRSSENTYERAIRHSFLGMLFESSHYLGLEIRGRWNYMYIMEWPMKFFDGRVSLLRWAVSADMAHGTHPNFPEKHEEHHRPELQKGLVIKHNANQRYATSSVTAFLFREVAAIHGIPTQVRSSERLIDSDTEIEERERERERD